MISGGTKILGVMGHPVRHSLSPAMHNASFDSLGLDFAYVALPVAPEALPEAVRGAISLGFRGFNLTMPHKEAVVPLLDELDDAARISGAVNTVVIEDSGETKGYNTDGYGMVEACREVGASVAGGTVALLGAGGAASAIALAFELAGAAEIHVFNRSTKRAEELAAKLAEARSQETPTDVRLHTIEELEELGDGDFKPDILVNATSLGMNETDALPVPEPLLHRLRAGGTTVIADAVYRSGGRTRLLDMAESVGLRTVTGQRMLLYQGVEAQRLWTGVEPDVSAMDAALG